MAEFQGGWTELLSTGAWEFMRLAIDYGGASSPSILNQVQALAPKAPFPMVSDVILYLFANTKSSLPARPKPTAKASHTQWGTVKFVGGSPMDHPGLALWSKVVTQS